MDLHLQGRYALGRSTGGAGFLLRKSHVSKVWNPSSQQARRGGPGGVEKCTTEKWNGPWDPLCHIKMTWFLICSYLHFKTTNPVELGTVTQAKTRSWRLCWRLTSGFGDFLCVLPPLSFYITLSIFTAQQWNEKQTEQGLSPWLTELKIISRFFINSRNFFCSYLRTITLFFLVIKFRKIT